MEDSLLKSSRNNQFYDPFASPPDLDKAYNHRKATQVGIDKDEEQRIHVCPCCENVIEKIQIPLNCNDEDLLMLGIGYPLFYKLTRYFGMVIFMIFIISGGGFYFLVTLNCVEDCVYFFGIPIINLQMSGEDTAKLTDVVNMVAAFAIFGCVLYVKSKIKVDIEQLEKKVIQPDQYTIMLQNLPENVTEQDLIQWSKQNFQAKPILINFAYNITELANAYKNRQELTIKLNKTLISRNSADKIMDPSNVTLLDCEVNDLKEKIQGLDNLIQLYKEQKITCHKIGTAFLTFSDQKTVKDILSKYEDSLAKVFLNKLLSPFRNPPLLFRMCAVVITRAPGPREVIWQNLSYSFSRSVIAEIIFIFTMMLVLFFSFKFQYLIVDIAYKFRHESSKTGKTIAMVQALAMSIVVVIVNSLFRLMIKLFAYFKKYYSYSSYHSSFCLYYSLSYIFNTCLTIYIVHSRRDLTQLKAIESDSVLIYDIHLIMLANAFSQPLYKVIDPEMWFRLIKRKYISNLRPDKNPYTQSYVNLAWEGYQIQIADNYQYIFRILVITTWFAHSAPLGVVFSIVGLFLDYWIGRFLLLRIYKRPESISKQIAVPMIQSLELLPLIYICGVLQFTYKVSNSDNILAFFANFLQYGATIVVILICILGYMIIYKPNEETISSIRYDEVESMFPYNYETENPITKFKGQMKYLYGVLKQGTNITEERIIKELLTLNLKNQNSYAERQSAIVKIKRNNLKRLQTLETSQQFLRQNEQQKKKRSTSSDTSNKKSQYRHY